MKSASKTTSYESELRATSDEQHRIRKMIRGSTGTKNQDAMDEVLDNAIGENATVINIKFTNKKINFIYNNGTPMNLDDRRRFIKLDTRCKKVIGTVTPKKRKGMHGIGEALSRGRLAGQGKQITTTKNEDNICHQIVIDLKGLTAEDYNQPACWSMDHEDEKKNLRPKWKKIQEVTRHEQYKIGVTKEYQGEHLEQNFELNDVIFHIADKYARNIELGLKITIEWEDKKYEVPLIYINSKWDKKTYILKVYTDLIEFNMDCKRQTVHKNGGTWRKSKCDSDSKRKSISGDCVGTLTFTLQSPKKCETFPKMSENPVMGWFNQCLSDAFTNKFIEREGKLYLTCGENEVFKDLHQVQGRTNHLTETLLDFNKGLSISMDNMKLATNQFDIDLALKKRMKGDQFAGQAFRLDINFKSDETIIKPQENKNVITVPSEVTKALHIIFAYETTQLNEAIKNQRDATYVLHNKAKKISTPAVKKSSSAVKKSSSAVKKSSPAVVVSTNSLSPEQKTNVQDVNRLLKENTHEAADSLALLQGTIESVLVGTSSPNNAPGTPQNTIIMNISEKDDVSFKEFDVLCDGFKLCFNDGKITDFEVIKLMKNRIQMNSKKK